MKAKRRFEVFQGVRDKRWYWRCVARNRQIVATGGEGYERRSGALRSLTRLLADISANAYTIATE